MKNLFLLIAFFMPASVCHATQQPPNIFKTVEFAAATTCVTSLVALYAWCDYEIQKINSDKKTLESVSEKLNTTEKIRKLNNDILTTHDTMIGVGVEYRARCLAEIRAHALKQPKIDLKKSLQAYESHDATPCGCETDNNWNRYAKIRKKGPCPMIASAHIEMLVALSTYADSEIAPTISQIAQRTNANKNNLWWATTIGIVSGAIGLASVCSLHWKIYTSGKK